MPIEVIPSFSLMWWTLFANLALAYVHLLITWHIAQQSKGLVQILGISCFVLGLMLSTIEANGVKMIQTTSIIVWVTAVPLAALALRSKEENQHQ